MKYQSVSNPRWANAAQTLLDCDVDFEGLGLVPFTASAGDTATAVDIFERAVAGEFGAIAQYAAPVVSLADRKAAAWELIKAHRDSLSESGGYLVNGKWFHSDSKSKTQQLALARKADKVQAAGGDMAAQFSGNSGFWKTMDGSFVAMNATLAQAIADAAELQEGALFAAAETHRQAMEASADPTAYDFSGGWPDTFQG